MKRVLSDRMTSSESLEAATQILNFYSVGKKDVGASYLGAIAQVLSSYPRQDSDRRCATPHGIAATRPDFPPSVGHVIAWCDGGRRARVFAPLYAQEAREQHIEQQFREREEAAIPRAERPNISNYQHREPQQGRRAHLHVLQGSPAISASRRICQGSKPSPMRGKFAQDNRHRISLVSVSSATGCENNTCAIDSFPRSRLGAGDRKLHRN